MNKKTLSILILTFSIIGTVSAQNIEVEGYEAKSFNVSASTEGLNIANEDVNKTIDWKNYLLPDSFHDDTQSFSVQTAGANQEDRLYVRPDISMKGTIDGFGNYSGLPEGMEYSRFQFTSGTSQEPIGV